MCTLASARRPARQPALFLHQLGAPHHPLPLPAAAESSGLPAGQRGTYAGVAAKVEHFKEMGINAGKQPGLWELVGWGCPRTASPRTVPATPSQGMPATLHSPGCPAEPACPAPPVLQSSCCLCLSTMSWSSRGGGAACQPACIPVLCPGTVTCKEPLGTGTRACVLDSRSPAPPPCARPLIPLPPPPMHHPPAHPPPPLPQQEPAGPHGECVGLQPPQLLRPHEPLRVG